MRKIIILSGVTLLLSGCLLGQVKSDGDLNKPPEYTKYFKGDDVLIEDKVRVSVIATAVKAKPKEHLDDPLWEVVNFRFYISNMTPRNVYLYLESVDFSKEDQKKNIWNDSQELYLIPMTVSKIPAVKKEILSAEILKTDTKITLLFTYKVGSNQYIKRVFLKRWTKEEYKKRKREL